MKQIDKEKIYAYIAALCLYANIPPYMVWHNSYGHLLSVLFAIICLSNFVIKGCKKGYTGFWFLILYLIFSIRLDSNILGFIKNVLIIPIFFVKEEFILKILKAFKNVLGIFLFLGFISYIIIKFTPINLPYAILEPLNPLKDYNYLQYPFCVETNVLSDFNYRFCAQFDEPGVVGTLCGILLFADNFNLKKWTNIVFLISGIFTFSLFFYVLVLFYIIIHASLKYKILIVSLLSLICCLLYNDEIVYKLVFSRFEIEDGEWVGDNRAIYEFDKFYEKFRFSFDYFVGIDNPRILKLNEGGSTYKQIIVRHGFIFFSMYVMSFFIVAKRCFKSHYFLYVQFGVILLGTLYQRPMIANYAYVFLFYSSIFQIAVNSKQIINK